MSLPKFKKDAHGQIITETWTSINIHELNSIDGIVTDWQNTKIVWSFHCSRKQYFSNRHRLNWIVHRFNYFGGLNKYYQMKIGFYDRKTGIALDYQNAISKYNSAKATLTKYNNKLKQYADHWQPTLLMQTIEQDPNYQKAKQKIALKEKEVQENLSRVLAEINNIKK